MLSCNLKGVTPNCVLKVGLTVQQDLIDIILRLRQYHYVFTADVGKMYRQVKVNDRSVQKLLSQNRNL
jgi:hypothetical protein